MSSPSTERRAEFWETICHLRSAIRLGFSLAVTLFVLTLFSFLFIPPESATYVVLQMNLVVLTVTLVGLAVPLYRCGERE